MVSSPELGFKFFTKATKTVPDPIYTPLACEGGRGRKPRGILKMNVGFLVRVRNGKTIDWIANA